MRRTGLIITAAAVLGLAALLAIFWPEVGPSLSGLRRDLTPADQRRCAADRPCRIRILYAYTAAGLAELEPRTAGEKAALAPCHARTGDYGVCVLERIAADDTASLDAAFRRSGITRLEGGRPDIVFETIALPAHAVAGLDVAGAADGPSMDQPSNYFPAPEFNRRMLGWLPATRLFRHEGRDAALVVVFTGLRDPSRACIYNSVQLSGIIVLPGCMAGGYTGDAALRLREQILFLHEAGHAFGAGHNELGLPQPCKPGPTRACAWEACVGRVCSPDDLVEAPDAFCTLTGQYNYGYADRFCRAHRRGEQGSGWILEWSHPGPCRTPGLETEACGDAGHDAVSVMRSRAWAVAHPARS